MPKKKKYQFKFRSIYLLVIATILFTASLIMTRSDIIPGLSNKSLLPERGKSEVSEKIIEISGVKVADFINKSTNGKSQNFYTIYQTPDYHLFYIPDQELFYVSITSYPYNEFRPLAEKQLLQSLGITREEACMLNVDLTTTTRANPDKAGEVYGSSFCE